MSQPKSNDGYIEEYRGIEFDTRTVLPGGEAFLRKALAQKDKEVAERIVCSAVRFNDKVWMGHRHMHALDAMHDELSYTMNRKEMNQQQTDRDQGFVTSTGRYVGREEGWDIAEKAGQIITRDNQKSGYLFSEDLW